MDPTNITEDGTDRLGELRGSLIAIDVLMSAVVAALPRDRRDTIVRLHGLHAEAARAVLLHEPISERTMAAFEHDVRRTAAMLATIAAGD